MDATRNGIGLSAVAVTDGKPNPRVRDLTDGREARQDIGHRGRLGRRQALLRGRPVTWNRDAAAVIGKEVPA